MLLKLTRQEEEISKKIDEVNAKIKAEKNTEITEMVDVFDMTPEELQEVLRLYKDSTSNDHRERTMAHTEMPHQMETTNGSKESEDNADAI